MTERRYSVQLSDETSVRDLALALRADVFRAGQDDRDAFDALALHGVMTDNVTGLTVCCFRLLGFDPDDGLAGSYSAHWYDLDPVAHLPGAKLELGRFCVAPHVQDPDVIRLAWAEITAELDRRAARTLFGCSSFLGANPARFAEALAIIGARHLGPVAKRPRQKAGTTIHSLCPAQMAKFSTNGLRAARAQIPPLLRTYLAMGGWTSDHAVIDAELGTTHVLTVLEVDRVPLARRLRMRELAAARRG